MNLNDALDLLKTGDPGSRRMAARELRKWNAPEVQDALAHALGDPDRPVREAAARTLMEIGDASTIRRLIPPLREGSPAVRNGARRILEQLCRIEPRALRDLSCDRDDRIRVFAANIMGGTGDHEFAAPLIGLLSDPDPNVVEAAMAALGQLGAREAVGNLALVARSAEPWLRFSAIDALGRIPDPAATRALLDLLTAVETEFLEPVVEALGRQGNADSVLPLVDLIGSRSEARAAVLRTLLGPLAPQVASLGRDSRLQPLARAAAEALGRNELPPRLATTTAVLLAGIGSGPRNAKEGA